MGTPEFKIYDAKEVSLVIAGIPIDSGFAEGEFVKLEQNEEDFKMVVGTDGSVTRSKTNNRTAKATVRLLQTSDGNAALSALNRLDKAQPNGAGVGTFLLKDRTTGTIVYQAEHCWIAKPPTVSMDKTATPREWQVDIADLDRTDG